MQVEVLALDAQGVPRYLLESYSGLSYRKVLNGVGTLEITLDWVTGNRVVGLGRQGRISVMIDGQEDWGGVITSWRATGDGASRRWELGYSSYERYLSRPITPADYQPQVSAGTWRSLSGPLSTVLRGLAAAAVEPFGAPYGWRVAPDPAEGPTVTWRGRWVPALETMRELAFGHGGDFWVERVPDGIELRTAQPRGRDQSGVVVFSEETGMLGEWDLEENWGEAITRAIVLGDGSGASQAMFELTNSALAQLVGEWPAVVESSGGTTAELESEGRAALADGDVLPSISIHVHEAAPYTYKTDWDLGDTVRVHLPVAGGTTYTSRILEVEVQVEGVVVSANVTIGYPKPSFLRRLRQLEQRLARVARR